MSYQQGTLYKHNGAWHVRYREPQLDAKGNVYLARKSQRIASVKDCPRKSEVIALKNSIMQRLNRIGFSTESSIGVIEFVETVWLPAMEKKLEPSSVRAYTVWWRTHLKTRLHGFRVRDFRTVDGENVMQSIYAREGNQLAHSTYVKLKTVMSAIFTHAKRVGCYDGANPIQGVSIPKGKKRGRPTYAYELATVKRMLEILPEPARTAVGVAAFTGLRSGEIRGLRWEDYQNGHLRIQRSVWRTHVKEATKTGEDAEAPGVVPVIPVLAKMLEGLRPRWPTGYVFPNTYAEPLNFVNLTDRVIKPILRAAGIAWWGWHAFRRGLATNLNSLGVDDTSIQAILRHSSVRMTQNSYIKPVRGDVAAAMERLQERLIAGAGVRTGQA